MSLHARARVCVCVRSCEYHTPAYAYVHNVVARSPSDMTVLIEMAVRTLSPSMLQQQVCFEHLCERCFRTGVFTFSVWPQL